MSSPVVQFTHHGRDQVARTEDYGVGSALYSIKAGQQCINSRINHGEELIDNFPTLAKVLAEHGIGVKFNQLAYGKSVTQTNGQLLG